MFTAPGPMSFPSSLLLIGLARAQAMIVFFCFTSRPWASTALIWSLQAPTQGSFLFFLCPRAWQVFPHAKATQTLTLAVPHCTSDSAWSCPKRGLSVWSTLAHSPCPSHDEINPATGCFLPRRSCTPAICPNEQTSLHLRPIVSAYSPTAVPSSHASFPMNSSSPCCLYPVQQLIQTSLQMPRTPSYSLTSTATSLYCYSMLYWQEGKGHHSSIFITNEHYTRQQKVLQNSLMQEGHVMPPVFVYKSS